MATPDKRQSGWWGSISGGIFSSAVKMRSEPEPQPERLSIPAHRLPALENGTHRDTPRPRVKFQQERSTSPDSPVVRASTTQMAGRKIHERPQGPSNKLSTSTVKATNFSVAAASPRPMFRASIAPDGGRFSFTPRRGTPKPFKESLRPSAGTPSVDGRASTSERIGRGMSRIPPSELFAMKIPEPPANLSGEELARRVPKNPNRVGSIYADEYLADLCPKDFTEAQRKQFFCILDLRRLKYASDEIYLKKDWRFNILNFAKEYEKSRSLIMLRYGLYEFKSIKPSQEVVSKWKADHGIPDDEPDSAPAPGNEPYANGTEGILSRGGGKRKASEEPGKSSMNFAVSQGKRARGEREPLMESATPALNKGNKKRLADDHGDAAPSKLQKAAAPSPAKAPSATKKFFEQVANSKPAGSFQMSVEPPSTSKPKSSAFTTASATRSIFENSAKSPASKLSAPKPNIFGHLSDTGSAQASGAENDAGDEGDSGDESEAPDASQSDEPSAAASGGVATPQPAGPLFGAKKSGAAAAFPSSSESSDAGGASATGTSIFDRITKGEDGKPKRLLDSVVPTPAASENERPASPIKDQRPLGGDQTWTAGTPIKFGTAQPAAVDSTPAGTKLFSFGVKPSADEAATSAPKFGQAPASAAPSLFGSQLNGSATSLFGKPAATAGLGEKKADAAPAFQPSDMFGGSSTDLSSLKESSSTELAVAKPESDVKAVADKSATPAHPMFGAVPGQTPTPTFGLNSNSKTKPLFDSTSKPLFGADPNAPSDSKPSFTAAPKPLFGAAKPDDAPKPLFGAAPKADEPLQPKSLFGTSKPAEAPKSLFGAAPKADETPKSLFGAAPKTDEAPKSLLFGATPAAQSLFGSGPSQESSTPTFGLGAAKDPPKSSLLFGSGSQPTESKSLFGSAPAATNAAPTFSFGSGAANPTTAAKPLFGAGAQVATGSSTLFGSSTPASGGVKDSAAPATKPLFGASTTGATPQATPSFSFGSTAATTETPKTQSTLFGSSAAAPAPTPSFSFGSTQNGTATPTISFGAGTTQNGTSTPSFTFGASQSTQPAEQNGSVLFGSGTVSAPGSFAFGGSGDNSFKNPFAGGSDGGASVSFNFGGTPSQPAAGNGSGGMFSFGGGSTAPSNGTSTPIFSFGGGAAPDQGNAAAPIFNLAPPMGGTSTGTNTPFTLGGASSLATTPAQGTPEPAAADRSEQEGQKADDGDEEKQAQINLTEGGPGEEDEHVVFEVRGKALKLSNGDDSDDEKGGKKKDKSPWKTMGVGPVRLLKHKTTGVVRILLRGEPRGNIVMNKVLLPDFSYKTEKGDKYVKVPAASDSGTGLETWMLQVKDAAKGKALAAALEQHKVKGEDEK
ncbi:hypothetical protein RB594_002343 [Gaeumannomyces avenae]